MVEEKLGIGHTVVTILTVLTLVTLVTIVTEVTVVTVMAVVIEISPRKELTKKKGLLRNMKEKQLYTNYKEKKPRQASRVDTLHRPAPQLRNFFNFNNFFF